MKRPVEGATFRTRARAHSMPVRKKLQQRSCNQLRRLETWLFRRGPRLELGKRITLSHAKSVNLASIVFQCEPEEVFAFEVGSGGEWFREMKDSVAPPDRKDSWGCRISQTHSRQTFRYSAKRMNFGPKEIARISGLAWVA